MKINVKSLRETRTTKEVDITPFLSEEIAKQAGGKMIIEIRSLTTKERDDNMGVLSRYTEFDKDAAASHFNDPEWVHESRIQLLLVAVNSKREDFPFETWDRKTIDEIDETCPDLLIFLGDELEILNRPLPPKKSMKSSA